MAAVSTMILRSMRMVGEKARGETLDANEAVECLAELNTMLESWGTQKLNCYALKSESFALTSGVDSYTIGTGGAFNTDRPTKLVDPCSITDASFANIPLRIVDAETFGRVPSLSTTETTYPVYISYDQDFDASGLGTISFYPVPSSGLTVIINSWKRLQNFASVSTQVLLPPGYQLAIESNFAIHLAAGLTPVSQEVAKIARESLAAVRGLNSKTPVMALDYYGTERAGHSIITGP